MKKNIAGFILCIFFVAGLFGNAPDAGAAGDERREITVGMQNIKSSLDPAIALANVGFPLSYQMFDTLIIRDFGANESGTANVFKPGLAKSWKSQTWPHKYECVKACQFDLSQVGTSPRQQFRDLMQADDRLNPEAERLVETLLDSTGDTGAFDRVAGSIDELHEQREEANKKQRAARKKKKKGKKCN